MTTETIESHLVLREHEIKKAALVFRAIKHPLRGRILHLMHSRGQVTVSEMYGTLGLEQSVTSQHLSILRKARLVKTKREGRFIFYSINYERVDEIHAAAGALLAL